MQKTGLPRIRELADRYWEEHLRDDPLKATEVGDRRYDDRLPDIRPEATARRRRRLAELQAAVTAVDEQALDDVDRTTRDALLHEIAGDLRISEIVDAPNWNRHRILPALDLLTVASGRCLTQLATPESPRRPV